MELLTHSEGHYFVKFGNPDLYLEINEKEVIQQEEMNNGMLLRVTCNIEKKTMRVMKKTAFSKEFVEENKEPIIDGKSIQVDDQGTHWEGTVFNAQPYGFGCMYNESNKLVYKGFVYNGEKVCFGTLFYPETSVVSYSGTYYKNKRHGRGIVYDSVGKPIYDGFLFNDSYTLLKSMIMKESQLDWKLMHPFITSFIADRNSCQHYYSFQELTLVHFQSLKTVELRIRSFRWLQKLHISHCPVLETVSIGVSVGSDADCGVFHISDCLQLQSLSIGDDALKWYHQFVVESLLSL